MADILLTHGYFLDEDEKEKLIMRPYAPMGLMYLSAYLKKQNFRVDLFDSTFGLRGELYQTFQDNPHGIVGIYTNLMTRPSVIAIMKEAKNHGWTIILGGPESANYIDEYITWGADFIVAGEGEQTLTELMKKLQSGDDDFQNITGLSFCSQDGSIINNQARDMPRDIDQYPWPDRDAIDMQQYFDAWMDHHNTSSVSMITARGCPYKCTWCSHAVYGYSHRRRDYMDCADELEHIVKTYNPKQIWYADDVFSINPKWLHKYAAELKKRGLRVPFETISRADRLDAKTLNTLQEMGCYRIWIGAESGSQRLLDEMKRGVTIEQINRVTKEAQKRGIIVGMFLMWGFGSETIEDIDETVKQVAEINPDIYLTTVAYPIKGTAFYKEWEDQISRSVKWEKGSDRDLLLATRKSPRYYRYANKYLKYHVQATQLSNENPERAALKNKHARWSRRLLEVAADD